MKNAALISRWRRVCENIDAAKLHIYRQQGIKPLDAAQQRQADKVCLLAVSKTKPTAMIIALLGVGQTDFGENYLQEAIDKMAVLESWRHSNPAKDMPSIVWHYIGHIQRNKTRDIAEHFDWVHTIERDVVAKRLNNQRPDNLPKLNVLIQINIDNEAGKSGCHPEAVEALVETIKGYNRLTLRGLMIIPSKANTNAFGRTKTLFDKLADKHPELDHWDTLSMGMSADLEEAIQQGATMVRVGSAIFGERE